MDKLTKHLCLRISETQLKKLADILVAEQMGKSELIRNIIQDYLKSNGNKVQWHNHKLK
jgi:metal-responsive CopG/Arc/MetJ family transcriptional regulator